MKIDRTRAIELAEAYILQDTGTSFRAVDCRLETADGQLRDETVWIVTFLTQFPAPPYEEVPFGAAVNPNTGSVKRHPEYM